MASPTIENEITQLMKITDREEFIKHLGGLSAILIEQNYPFVPAIVERIKNTPQGEIHITLRTYDGRVQTAVFTELTKVSYK